MYIFMPSKSNFNGSCQKMGVICHFITLNSILTSLNNIFAIMVSVKMGYHLIINVYFY